MLRTCLERTRSWSLLLCLSLALAACKEDVYTRLSEREVNEMVAVLAAAGIAASRERDEDKGYALRVEAAEVPAAITLLRNAGYPRETFETLGEVFSSEGVFGTPFEQHARFIHAMNQELSATITAIDGVRSARVLVTAPPRGRFDRETPRATASVAIHHERGRDIRSKLSSIKMLVAHALPNLDYDDVAVALFEAGGPVVQPAPQGVEDAAGPPARAMVAVPVVDGLIGRLSTERAAAIWFASCVVLLVVVVVAYRRRSS